MTEPLLHERYPSLRESLPRVELCRTPSPVRELGALGRVAGLEADLWLKDDSRIATPWGGNKPRKLEWILADARRRRHRRILTFGGIGTHHGLATAIYARRVGIACTLALVDQPVDDHVREQLEMIGRSGARVHRTRTKARTILAAPFLLVRNAQLWPPRPPYVLPAGGSSPVGAVGFVEAGLELAEQVGRGELPEPGAVVVPVGTGGTAAGLLVGLRLAGLRSRVVGVVVSDLLDLSERAVLRLADRTHRLIDRRSDGTAGRAPELRSPADLVCVRDFLGAGYGHATPEGAEAEALAREHADLEPEPVYTAKAIAAMLALARSDELPPGPVLYWHTHSATAPGEGA